MRNRTPLDPATSANGTPPQVANRGPHKKKAPLFTRSLAAPSACPPDACARAQDAAQPRGRTSNAMEMRASCESNGTVA